MIIFPAIDIKGGECVRLLKGSFKDITKYKKTPLDQAKEFFNLEFKNIHIVDLDGALKANPINDKIIKEICKIDGIKIQVGGGVRSSDHIKKFIDFGVDKVILGTAAIESIDFLKKATEKFNNKIALSIDVRNGYIALSGWKKQTAILASDYIKKIKDISIARIIYTDIDKDGTNTGPNFENRYKIADRFNIPVIISGGISSMNDINKVIKDNKKIEGIIVGKAIYEERIRLEELSKIN